MDLQGNRQKACSVGGLGFKTWRKCDALEMQVKNNDWFRYSINKNVVHGSGLKFVASLQFNPSCPRFPRSPRSLPFAPSLIPTFPAPVEI